MIRALYSSASWMQAQQLNLDAIANNLSNMNTAGFKRTRVGVTPEHRSQPAHAHLGLR